MLISSNAQSPENLMTHPFFNSDDSAEVKADKIKSFLLELSKSTEEKELKTACRQTADFFREKFYGLSDRQVRSRITAALEEYFDGENYIGIEIENLAEETGIREKVLLPILQQMVKKGIVLQGRRRRHNELGEHYNAIFKLCRK